MNAVSPGIVDSNQQVDTHTTSEINLTTSAVQNIPMCRMGLPTEVAQAVLWLLSSEASYVTGSILTVAGGR